MIPRARFLLNTEFPSEMPGAARAACEFQGMPAEASETDLRQPIEGAPPPLASIGSGR